MTCYRSGCGGRRAAFSNLCHKCADIRDSAIIVGLCCGLSLLIVAMAKFERLL